MPQHVPSGAPPPLPAERIAPRIDIAGFFIDAPPFAPRYRVRGAHLVLVTGGAVAVHLAEGRRATARRGHLVAWPDGVNRYRVVGDEPLVYYQIHLRFADEQRGRGWPEVGGRPLPGLVDLGAGLPRAVAACEAIIATFLRPHARAGLVRHARVLDLVDLAFAADEPAAAQPPVDSPGAEWQEILLRCECLPEPTVAALARTCGQSPASFIRRFTRYTGMTPRQYLISRRLWRARRLLADGASVKEAAHRSGFVDPRYLARRFRRAFGCAPSRAGAATNELVPLWPVGRHLLSPGVSLDDYRP